MSESLEDQVAAAAASLGATIINRHGTKAVDLEIDGISGFARKYGNLFRMSLFLAVDPDEEEAEDFVAAHPHAPGGHLELLHQGTGSALRFLIEVPFEEVRGAAVGIQSVRVLRTAWAQYRDAGSAMVEACSEAGIAKPPLGSAKLDELYTYDQWWWGSRHVHPAHLYMFQAEWVARQLIADGPFFALSHAGHGMNSYGLSLVTCSGPVSAYVQHAFRAPFGDPVQNLIDINATYSRLRVLMNALQDRGDDGPAQWLILSSEFRGHHALVDLECLRQGASPSEMIQHCETESEVFERVVERLGLSEYDFGTAGNVTW